MSRVSIIVPCYNEEPGIPHLSSRLRPVLQALGSWPEVEVVFVDDGSQDRTLELLQQHWEGTPGARIVRHRVNRGATAAMWTGLAVASGDIRCTIDSDCTYDPVIIRDLVAPIVAGAADVVTASPYHPQGEVVGVPAWRLALSRVASFMYSQLLPVKLYTYTSCCRAYRADMVSRLGFEDPGFRGVAELLVSAIQNGSRVAEVPARLEVRRHGFSKMRTFRVMRSHLRFMGRLALGARVTRLVPVTAEARS